MEAGSMNEDKLDQEAWPSDDIRRAFVAGAKWWEYHSQGATMWQSDQRLAEAEAERRYPNGKINLYTRSTPINY